MTDSLDVCWPSLAEWKQQCLDRGILFPGLAAFMCQSVHLQGTLWGGREEKGCVRAGDEDSEAP